MRKLTFIPPRTYQINARKRFVETLNVNADSLMQAYDFAYQMCFGDGHHRSTRTGGQSQRRNGEKFCNTFQGKLAEIVLYNFFVENNIECTEVDFRIMGEREWDDSDLIINKKRLNVKSAAYFSNLLLLEQNDWNMSGHYIPNMESERSSKYDFFLLVRIKPDIKGILKENRLLYSDTVNHKLLQELIISKKWFYDFPGFITQQEFVEHVIGIEQILPQNARLNGKVPMDASNYYVQAGDLHPISEIIQQL